MSQWAAHTTYCYNAMLKESSLASVTLTSPRAITRFQVLSSKLTLCRAPTYVWKHALFLRQPTSRRKIMLLVISRFSVNKQIRVPSRNLCCILLIFSICRSSWWHFYHNHHLYLHAFLKYLLQSASFLVLADWLFWSRLVHYTLVFGGHGCCCRILIPDNEPYRDAVNCYDREALRRTVAPEPL